MIPFMLLTAVALFGEMSKFIAVIALQIAEVLAIIRSVSAPVAILTGCGRVVVRDPIQKMLRLRDRDIGLVGPMPVFFPSIPPIVFIFDFALEMHDTEGVFGFIGHKVCLNVVLQPLIPARVEGLRNHLSVCEIAYFEFRFHQVNAINDGFYFIQEG